MFTVEKLGIRWVVVVTNNEIRVVWGHFKQEEFARLTAEAMNEQSRTLAELKPVF